MRSLLHLIECWDQTAQEATGLERVAHLNSVIIRIGHVEEEEICVGLVESLDDVAQLEVDARFEPKTG